MKRLFTTGVALLGLGIPVLVVGGACSKTETVKPGAPVLTKFILYPDNHDTFTSIDTLAPDAGAVSVQTNIVVSAVFDRILDGSKIETAMEPKPLMPMEATPIKGAVTASSTGMPAVAAIELNHRYMPGGINRADPGIRPGPSVDAWPEKMATWPVLDMMGMPKPTPIVANVFPSGSTVSFTLSRTAITAKAGEPFTGKDVHTFATDPLAFLGDNIMTDKMTMKPLPVDGATFVLKLSFSSVLDPASASGITIIDGGGMAVPARVTLDATDPTYQTVVVQPDNASKKWAAGADYTVTVGADVADVYGVKLGAAEMSKLTTKAAADAGAGDGGAGG